MSMLFLFPKIAGRSDRHRVTTNFGEALNRVKSVMPQLGVAAESVSLSQHEFMIEKDLDDKVERGKRCCYLTFNTYGASLDIVRRRPDVLFAFWVIDDIRFIFSEFKPLLNEPNTTFFLADRRMWRDLAQSHPAKVHHLPWAGFMPKARQQLAEPMRDIVFVGNIGSYLSLPELDKCGCDKRSEAFIRAVAERLMEDLRFDVRRQVLDELRGHGIPDERMPELATKIEYIIRSEANRRYRLEVFKTFDAHGLRVRVFGDKMWVRMGLKHIEYEGAVTTYSQLREIFSRSAISLSLDSLVMSDSAHLRIFDSVMTGTFTISQHTPIVGEIFGGDVPVFASPSQAVELIGRYLDAPEVRREMAESAWRTCLREHLVEHRCMKLIDHVKEWTPLGGTEGIEKDAGMPLRCRR
jgi:spore maturation protein CgeB